MIRWEDPPGPTAGQPVGKARQTAEWAKNLRYELRRQPGKWACLKEYESATRAWGALTELTDRGLFNGCELKAASLPADRAPHRSALYGRWVRMSGDFTIHKWTTSRDE